MQLFMLTCYHDKIRDVSICVIYHCKLCFKAYTYIYLRLHVEV